MLVAPGFVCSSGLLFWAHMHGEQIAALNRVYLLNVDETDNIAMCGAQTNRTIRPA